MSFRRLILSCLAITVCGGGGFFVRSLMAGDSVPVGSPAPKTGVARTNSAPPSRNGLLRLEEELSKSFGSFKPQSSSLEGVSAPLPPPPRKNSAVQNKRLQDEMDRRKNWMFMNPDELMGAPKSEEFFTLPEYGPDGQEKKPLSAIDRFYQNLEHKNTRKEREQLLRAADPMNSHRPFSTAEDALDTSEDPSLPPGLRETEQALRKKLLGDNSDSRATSSTRSSLWDLFGTSEKTVSPEALLAHKEYMKQYQQWLDTPPANPFNPVAGAGSSLSPSGSTSGLDAFGSLNRPDTFGQPSSSGNPALFVASPQDVNAKVINQWNPLYSAPKTPAPQTPAPTPIFDVPRRKF
jgi:hypothetical protein